VGIDPDGERIRVAGHAMGDQAELLTSMASRLPNLAVPADLVLLLDMLHYLDDESVKTLFANCFTVMASGGLLLIRYVIIPKRRAVSWSWKFEDMRARSSGGRAYYRSTDDMVELLGNAGFKVEVNMVTKTDEELVWLTGRVI
jgi:cyclopropane fatty-acyl-phospholipid synthase-like methyltransferase